MLRDGTLAGQGDTPRAGSCKLGAGATPRCGVMAEERSPIQAKGIAKPVRNYAVTAPIDELVAQGRTIHEEQTGLRVLVDFQKLDKAKAVKALESILSRLKT